MKIKKYVDFLNESDAPAPPSQTVATPPVNQQTQQTKPAQEVPSIDASQTTAQTTQQASTETKSGDLSNYDNQEVTKNPDTVKKMVDMIKDMDKTQLIKLRNLIGELKNMEDPKTEIGKL